VPSVDQQTVRHIAKLARIRLEPDEVERFAQQLGHILEYMHVLNEVDTSQVPPLCRPLAVYDALRDDEPAPSLPVAQVLANAPDTERSLFRVPRVLDSGA